jgi:hypothetical protein
MTDTKTLREWAKNGHIDPNDFAEALDEIDRLREALQKVYDEAVDGRLSLTKGQLIASIAANALATN